MVREEGDERIRVRVQGIVSQHIGDASHRRIPQEDIAQSEEQWVIEDRGKPAIDAVVAARSTDKKRSHRRIRVKHFADRCQERAATTASDRKTTRLNSTHT